MSTTHASGPQVDEPVAEFSFPLTATQARCWFLDQLRPGDPSLNVAVRWELLGSVPDRLVEAAFQGVIARHEVLRSRLVARDGTPVQDVLPSVDFRLTTQDLRTTPADRRDAHLDAVAHDMSAEPFDLARPPLIRVKRVRLDDTRTMLLIVAHQSVFDGYSIGVLGSEFGTILDALEKGREPILPDLPLQYGDYALWQAEYLASEAVKEDTDFWKAQLADVRYFEVEPDLPRPVVRGTNGANVHADLPVSFGGRLEQAAKRHDMSPFSYGVGVLSMALHHFTGAKEVVLGTQIAGRDEVELEGLIGVFINNLVLRLPTRPGTRLADHLASAKTVVKDALLHQNMPFNKLVEALRPTRDLSRNPLVSINFNLQRNTFLKNKRYDTFELISRPSQAAGVIYDFNFLLIGRPDAWRLALEYSTDLFTRETAQQLLEMVLASFEQAFDRPETALAGMQRVADAAKAREIEPRTAEKRPEQAVQPRPAPGVTELASRIRPAAPTGTRGVSLPTGTGWEDDSLRRLAGIWSELLELPAEYCDDDFFKLGGHSLLAMRMLARAEAEFGVKPGIGAFLAEPNLRAFARRLSAGAGKVSTRSSATREAASTWELIELRAADRSDPVIVTLNHPIFYYLLAKSFAAGVAIANLRITDAASIAAQRALPFDEICAEATGQIASAYAGRPIVLLGLCVNGRVALNVARQLEDTGASVTGVVMIDSWAPGTFKNQAWLAASLRKWAVRRRRWQHYLALWLKGRIGTRDLLGKNATAARLLQRLGIAEPNVAEVSLLGDVADHLLALTRDYRFSNYDGEALLFKTDASPAAAIEMKFGWESILSEDTPVYPIRGWHEDALSNTGISKVARIIEIRLLESAAGNDRRRQRRGTAATSTTAGDRGMSAA